MVSNLLTKRGKLNRFDVLVCRYTYFALPFGKLPQLGRGRSILAQLIGDGEGFGFDLDLGTSTFGKGGDTGEVGLASVGIGDTVLATNRFVETGADDFGAALGWGDGDCGWSRFDFGRFGTRFGLSLGEDDDAGYEETENNDDGEDHPECFFAI